MARRRGEEQVIAAEEVVGVSLFNDPNQYHIVYVLATADYMPRLPQFKEILDIITEESKRGAIVSLRPFLSAETYNFWESRSNKYAIQLNFQQRVEDSLSFLLQTARHDRLRRALENNLLRISPLNVGDILTDILNEISMIIAAGKNETLSGAAIKAYLEEHIQTIYTYKKFPLFTHLPFLDHNGIFLARREYSLFSGRTGVGKTSCAAILTFNLLTSHERNDEYAAPYPLRVLFLSTEMPAESVVAKILGTFTHCYILPKIEEFSQFDERDVDVMRKLRWTDFYTRTKEEHLETIKKVISCFVEYAGDRFAIYHSPIVTSQDIFLVGLSQAVKWQAIGGSLDVYIVDFIQNVRTKAETEMHQRERTTISREIAMVSQEFQHFCGRFNTAGMLLSQVNDMGDVRDSRVVEHLAALHLQLGLFQRDISHIFKQFFLSHEMWGGRPVSMKEAQRRALKYAEIINRPSSVRYLDIRVVKNRYGDVLRNIHFIVWNPSIPKIENVYDLPHVVSELERQVEEELGKEEPKDALVEKPQLNADELFSDQYPF